MTRGGGGGGESKRVGEDFFLWRGGGRGEGEGRQGVEEGVHQ